VKARDPGASWLTERMSFDRPWLAHYAPDVPAEIAVPEGSLVDMLDSAVESFGDRVALDFFGRETTFATLSRRVSIAASALRDLGVERGDRVAVVLPNCTELVVVFHAILRLGAIVVEHNPLYTEDELAYQFADHGARVIICWDSIALMAQQAAPQGATVVAVNISRDLPASKRLALRLPIARARAMRAAMTKPAPGLIRWSDLIAAAHPLDPSAERPAGDDVALLQYTGGTTGRPKGAILTHRNLLANGAQSVAWVPMLKPGSEVFYAALPLFHAYGVMLCLVTPMMLGATTVLFPRFDVDQMLDAMERKPATFLPGVPPMYPRLVDRAKERNVSLRSVKVALAGAMSLAPEIVELWENASGGLLIEGYGMTETSPITLGNPASGTRRPGAIGVPFPSTDMRIVDRNDPTADVAPGEPGELLVQGPQVFSGYWNKPEETAQALLPGGWMRTGDVVVQDPDSFVRVVDRIKELILVGGFNVYPTEVERVLAALPGITEAAVVGLPGEGGEQVVAAVVLEPGAQIDGEAVRAECRRHLAGYKVPREIVVVEALPVSTIGKVLHGRLRERLIEQRRPMGFVDGRASD
jgi:long-chain acyl-CoA synthetase